MPTPLTPRKRLIYFFILTAIFLAGVPVLVLYSTGWRLGDGFALEQRGGIYVSVPENGADVVIDNEYRMTTQFLRHDYFQQSLEPGQHWIAVRHEDYHEWYKEVNVQEQNVTPVYPFLVPLEYEMQKLVEVDPLATSTVATTSRALDSNDFEEIANLFELEETATSTNMLGTLLSSARVTANATVTPATATPDLLESYQRITEGDTVVWFDGNTVYAYWDDDDWQPQRFCNDVTCVNPMPVVTDERGITHVGFYPGRDDVIIFTLSDGVYVAEIDKRPRQVYQRIFEGRDVDFRREGNTLYIRDGEDIFEVET